MQTQFWEVSTEGFKYGKTICQTNQEIKKAIRERLEDSSKKVIVTKVIHDLTSISREELNLIDEQWPDYQEI